MSTRRVSLASLSPTFALVEKNSERTSIEREIAKVKPRVEVTIEGMTEIALGRIVEWHSARHFFAVEWQKLSPAFAARVESRSELRAFFKARLFSTQVVFKTMTVRQVRENLYHFRIPEQIYQQQRRGALRVPLFRGPGSAVLSTPQGEFPLLDLSVGGARLRRQGVHSKVRLGSSLQGCELKLGRKKIGSENFGVKITSETDSALGCRFFGLESADQVLIKQFLIEALRVYYREEL